MKNFKKLMMLATLSITALQSINAYDNAADDTQPRHQGFGRIFTAIENTATLHPGNAVNSLATGNQSDTTFGWHENDDNNIKANRADTERNNNDRDGRDEQSEGRRRDDRDRQSDRDERSQNRNNSGDRKGSKNRKRNAQQTSSKDNNGSAKKSNGSSSRSSN